MAKINFTLVQEKEIIDFYLVPNTLETTCKKFNLTRKVLYRILKTYCVRLHSQEIICELRKKSYIERYGVDHPMKAKEVCEKHKQTCLDKYGVTNVSQCEDIKRKKKEAYLKKYGVDNPNKAEEIKIKKK